MGVHGKEIMDDIPNYTNIQPTMQISEIVSFLLCPGALAHRPTVHVVVDPQTASTRPVLRKVPAHPRRGE